MGCFISVSVLHICMYLTLYVCLSIHTHTNKLSNIQYSIVTCGFPASLMVQMVKNLLKMLEIWVQFTGWEDPLGRGMTTYPGLENSMDRGALWATVHGVGKSRM